MSEQTTVISTSYAPMSWFDSLLASYSFWLEIPMSNDLLDPVCRYLVHVHLGWWKCSGNVLTPSNVSVETGHNSVSMQGIDIGSVVAVYNHGLCWVEWPESYKKALSYIHVMTLKWISAVSAYNYSNKWRNNEIERKKCDNVIVKKWKLAVVLFSSWRHHRAGWGGR